MALRDWLAWRAAPYLEPGEQIQAVFPAQTGPSPYWMLLSPLIVAVLGGYRVIVVTDRAVVVLRAGRLAGTFPKEVLLRAPRAVLLGTPAGLWGRVQLDRRYWVHRRFHRDVASADAALRMMAAQRPAQPAPGPAHWQQALPDWQQGPLAQGPEAPAQPKWS